MTQAIQERTTVEIEAARADLRGHIATLQARRQEIAVTLAAGSGDVRKLSAERSEIDAQLEGAALRAGQLDAEYRAAAYREAYQADVLATENYYQAIAERAALAAKNTALSAQIQANNEEDERLAEREQVMRGRKQNADRAAVAAGVPPTVINNDIHHLFPAIPKVW